MRRGIKVRGTCEQAGGATPGCDQKRSGSNHYQPTCDLPYVRRGCKPLLLRPLGGGAGGNLTCVGNCVDGLSYLGVGWAEGADLDSVYLPMVGSGNGK